jgi:tetratricopeptide (TPR) repeat protein
MMSKHVLFLLIICALATVANAGSMQMQGGTAVARQHHAVSTTSAQAQAYFDQGLTLLYAFNRGAARHAFEKAAAADPHLAMAQWGIAASYGSNINVPIDAAGEQKAFAALQRAKQLSQTANELDRAWINALAARYSSAANPDFAALDHAYARAMANLAAKYPDDLDAATLYAESMMDLRPWALYTPAGQPVADTQTIVATLESVMRRDPNHIGANHFYIHATEASTTPERGLVAATRLSSMNFEPAAAHLVHMPAHTYMRTGAFEAAVMSNEHATQHDRAYLASNEDREASGYYQHNLTMLADGYCMLGNYAGANAAHGRLVDSGAMVPAMYVPLRFGRWADILASAQPAESADEPMRVAFWHFSRGMALAGTADVAGAKTELAAVKAADAALKLPAISGYTNSSADLLALAEDELGAKIAQADGDGATAVTLLENAVKTQDWLIYIEPPDWYHPVRESLGGLLVQQQRYGEAEAVFRADLRHNARNPRSLYGLAAALDGEGRLGDAQLVRQQFQSAWHYADTALTVGSL